MNIKGIISGGKRKIESAIDSFKKLSESTKANPYKEAQESLKQSFNKSQADAAARKIDAEVARDNYIKSQDLNIPALPLGGTDQAILNNKQKAIETFRRASDLVKQAKTPSEAKKMIGRKTTRADLAVEKRELEREQAKYDYLQSMGRQGTAPTKKVKVQQEQQEKLKQEATESKNPPPNEGANNGVGGNSTAGQADNAKKRAGNKNPGAEGAQESENQPGFFQKHWKATAATVGVGGLAACVGIANMMLAGGQQSNSNLYNPYQQQY